MASLYSRAFIPLSARMGRTILTIEGLAGEFTAKNAKDVKENQS
jgi:hypothetical protein